MDPRPEILAELLVPKSDAAGNVDMEWAWPPIQHPRNLAEFVRARLEGCDEMKAYERVLTNIANAYMTLLVDREAEIVSEVLITCGENFWSLQLLFNCPSKGYVTFRIEYDWLRTKLLSILEAVVRESGCRGEWRRYLTKAGHFAWIGFIEKKSANHA